MFYFFFMLFLFFSSVALHVIYCRYSASEKLHAKVYVFIVFVLIIVYIVGVLFLQHWGWLKEHPLMSAPFQITSGIIFVLLVPFYLIFYTLTGFVSPSQKILLSIALHGGLSYADVLVCVQEEDFIGTRLADLCVSGCVVRKQERYVLSPTGNIMATVLRWVQRVTGREIGG